MSKGPGGAPMNLPPGMLQMIMRMVQSGEWGTPEAFNTLFGQTGYVGQGAMKAGRNQYMRSHPQTDPFGWGETMAGTDYDFLAKSAPLSVEELNAQYPGHDYKSNIENFSHNLTPQEIAQIKAIKQDPKNWNIKGQALIDKLPPQFNTPEYQKMAANYQALDPSNMSIYNWPGISGGSNAMSEPMSLKDAQLAAAMDLGYGGKSLLQKNKGEFGKNDIVNTSQILQTLKGAGWDKSKGYGPQEGFSDNLNQMLFAISPEYDKSKIPVPEKDPRLSQVYDPFSGMQSAINRDAYVNDTLGGGFYGGVIPEKKDYRGGLPQQTDDPHFPVAQKNADGTLNMYPGWASNQAQQFGELPYDLFGMKVNNINDPFNSDPSRMPFAGNMVKNTAPPTWNGGDPTPWGGSGKTNTWGGGWAQNQQNQQRDINVSPGGSEQAQMYQKMFNDKNGPTFGASPWGGGNTANNPWGMGK